MSRDETSHLRRPSRNQTFRLLHIFSDAGWCSGTVNAGWLFFRQCRMEAVMKKDAKSMKEVAERCTHFSPSDHCGCSNTTSNASTANVTCKNCKHYEEDDVCELDLYAEILKNHDL